MEVEMAANEPIVDETVQEHIEDAHVSVEGPSMAHEEKKDELPLERSDDAFEKKQIHDLLDFSVPR